LPGSNYRIVSLSKQAAVDAWPVIAPILERATDCSRGRFSVADCKVRVEAGDFAVLAAVDANKQIVGALTAMIFTYPQMRVLEVVFLAGVDWAGWGQQMIETVDFVAQAAACRKIEFKGRRGWGPVLAHAGYKEYCVSYEKEVPCSTHASSGMMAEISTVH